MIGNKGNDTKPEILLRKALWHRGIRYRKNWRKLTGCPDIVLTRQKIAIFVDGDFGTPEGIRTDREARYAPTNHIGRRSWLVMWSGIEK